jgi:hypothetical protein
MSGEHQLGAGRPELKRLTLRLDPDDYDRLSAMASNEGVAMAVKARELMIAAMDPQIFSQRYYDVENLLRGVVKTEIESHSERLHKRLYRVGAITAGMVFYVRDILTQIFELSPQAAAQLWREALDRGSEYMGERRS